MSTNVPAWHRSDTIGHLAEALAKAQLGMTHAKKSAANPFFKSQYADLPAVLDAAKQPLGENGLAVVQIPILNEQGELQLITELIHTSGEWMRSCYPIRPVKGDPQSVGSAITYARRYSYQAMVGVAPIGEDDDGNAASVGALKTPNRSAHPRPFDRVAQAPAPREVSIEVDLPEPLPNPWLHRLEGVVVDGENACKQAGKLLVELPQAWFTRSLSPANRNKLSLQDRVNIGAAIANPEIKGLAEIESDESPIEGQVSFADDSIDDYNDRTEAGE